MKKTVSLTLAFSFLVMTVTGIMLYIAPKGKVAYWADWKMFGLSKTQYGDIHITSMVLFVAIAVWHIYYNWKPLISYIKNSAKQITLFKKELLIAFAINVFFVAGTLMGIQPLRSVLDLNEYIKTKWEERYGSPPYGHAEESSLKALVQHTGIELTEATSLLQEKGISVQKSSQTLLEIAETNRLSPKEVYDIIQPKKTGMSDVPSLGQKTLQELADMQKIDLEKSLVFLQQKGLDSTPSQRMKEMANALNTTPFALYKELQAL